MNPLSDYQDELMLYSLALLAIVTGLTKFTNAGLWLGEHGLGHVQLPFATQTALFVGGLIETGTGVALLTRRNSDLVASIIGLWLLAITVVLALNQLWVIAIRDFFLTVFAFLVATNEYSSNQD